MAFRGDAPITLHWRGIRSAASVVVTLEMISHNAGTSGDVEWTDEQSPIDLDVGEMLSLRLGRDVPTGIIESTCSWRVTVTTHSWTEESDPTNDHAESEVFVVIP